MQGGSPNLRAIGLVGRSQEQTVIEGSISVGRVIVAIPESIRSHFSPVDTIRCPAQLSATLSVVSAGVETGTKDDQRVTASIRGVPETVSYNLIPRRAIYGTPYLGASTLVRIGRIVRKSDVQIVVVDSKRRPLIMRITKAVGIDLFPTRSIRRLPELGSCLEILCPNVQNIVENRH